MKRTIFYSSLILLLISPIFFKATASEIKLESLNEKAPPLSFHDANGKIAHLSDYRGKKIILHFWASWCKPCLQELPELQKLALAGKSKDMIFLPLSGDDRAHEAAAKAFITSTTVPFWIAEGNTDAYLTYGLPETYFINEDGMILARALGQRDWAKQTDLPHFLDQLFSAKKP
jgi:cytochrome c biogenesis protein CcmG/thiol:disulfide interchange protein DsbE